MIETLVHNHVHRIYISASGTEHPTADACITLTDILRVMAGVW